ncbi:MAG: type II toxin-antitoxin system RelE/ParE family toxin [bacterium]|nr:type II toxin-antitoxin system RelE/ParE family toxin [bacterium]MDZ4232067.1 type II toxin-antitoxin system RelE/ParE family toxin [Candidatus Pacearchaeota archaeon]
MDKVAKALLKLSAKERERVRSILEKISKGELRGIDIKKLKGREDIFRVRKGDLRIVYRVSEAKLVIVLAIERRTEKTYKNI